MKRVIVHIDQLVLRGFCAQDRHAIAAGFQQQLGQVLADREALALLRFGGDMARLQVARVPLAHASPPQRVGEQVAQGIGREILK